MNSWSSIGRGDGPSTLPLTMRAFPGCCHVTSKSLGRQKVPLLALQQGVAGVDRFALKMKVLFLGILPHHLFNGNL